MSGGRAPLAALGALLLALTFGACGDGGESASSDGGPRVAPLKVSGGGSAQFRVQGADNSIADFGSEAPPAELRDAARLAHGYLAALAREDWSEACARLTREIATNAQTLTAGSPRLEGKGCAAALAALFAPVSTAEGREASSVDVAALRKRGEHGFLIYRGAARKPYFLTLQRQGPGWRVAGLSPTPLP